MWRHIAELSASSHRFRRELTTCAGKGKKKKRRSRANPNLPLLRWRCIGWMGILFLRERSNDKTFLLTSTSLCWRSEIFVGGMNVTSKMWSFITCSFITSIYNISCKWGNPAKLVAILRPAVRGLTRLFRTTTFQNDFDGLPCNLTRPFTFPQDVSEPLVWHSIYLSITKLHEIKMKKKITGGLRTKSFANRARTVICQLPASKPCQLTCTTLHYKCRVLEGNMSSC